MNETELLTVLATMAINACVTWGVLKTQLAWLRRDIDSVLALRDALAAHALNLSHREA